MKIKGGNVVGKIFRKSARAVLLQLQKILPRSIYDPFLDFVLTVYRGAQRWLYFFIGRFVFLGDPHKKLMVNRVHKVFPYSLVGVKGLEATYTVSQKILGKKIPGDFVELGVARGGCAALLAFSLIDAAESNRRLWLFDSFEGLPEVTEKDYLSKDDRSTGQHIRPLPKGSCLGTLEEVRSLMFENFKFSENRFEFVKGWFNETVPSTKNKIGPISVLRIDGDWYESTKTCLDGLYDQVSDGGAIIIDDYESCYGCKRAVDDFLNSRNLQVNLVPDGRGGAYFYKPGQTASLGQLSDQSVYA